MKPMKPCLFNRFICLKSCDVRYVFTMQGQYTDEAITLKLLPKNCQFTLADAETTSCVML